MKVFTEVKTEPLPTRLQQNQKFFLQPHLLPSGGRQIEYRFKGLLHWLPQSSVNVIPGSKVVKVV